MSTARPQPTGREIKFSSEKMLVSKTDARGVISYGNQNLMDISGYSDDDLLGTPHNILRHPDMPKAIFYLMWDSIKRGNNIMAVVKNLSKSGDHYWVTTDFDIQKNREGRIRNYIAFRQAASRDVIKTIEPIYSKMLEIEKSEGMDASLKYIETFLAEKDISYNDFIEELARPKGLSAIIFEKIKDMFK